MWFTERLFDRCIIAHVYTHNTLEGKEDHERHGDKKVYIHINQGSGRISIFQID